MRAVLIILGLLLAGVLSSWSAPARATACADPTPPPPAQAAGFARLAFCSDFNAADEIDLKSAQCPGRGPCEATKPATFKWYRSGKPFNWTSTEPDGFEVKDGVLTIWGGTKGIGLVSSFQTEDGYRGYAAGPSFYTEARIRINRFPPIGEKCHGGKTHWPSFWTMDACHLYGSCREYLEIDFFEYIECRADGTLRDAYGAAIHDWLAIDQWGFPCGGKRGQCSANKPDPDCRCHQKRTSNQWPKSKVGFFGERNEAGDNRSIRNLGWTDWDRTFHTVGTLVKSGETIDMYADDVRRTENSKTGAFRFLKNEGATERYPLILGSEGWPMSVDWVRVWVKP